MAVTIKVNGAANSLVHKGTPWIATSTAPDVCKTPSPAGPVPIPYPVIVSMSTDLADGTTTVKVDGGNMAAINGSQFTRCTGDEPGTAGGVVSSTNMKEAKWILYSMDVKLDGKNACRLTDKMTMNHMNTVCMAGTVGAPVPMTALEKELKAVAKKCDKKVEAADAKKKKSQRESCTVKGTRKHKCCQDAMEGKHKNVKCEYVETGKEDCRLDVAVIKNGKVSKIYDYKFRCTGPPKMSRAQERKYNKRFPGATVALVGP